MEPRILLDGIQFGESVRWHDGRAWFSDWGAGEVVAVDGAGNREVVHRSAVFPFSLDWLPDGRLLVVSDHPRREDLGGELVVHADLTNRRVWADLGTDVPDGICIDFDGAVWYADVPNQKCVRVREGGEVLQTVSVDRGCFSCALGGEGGRTLFIVATVWGGPEAMAKDGRTGQLLAVELDS